MSKKTYPDTLVVEVTQEDIDKAVSLYKNAVRMGGWAGCCPISNAVRRLYPDDKINTTAVLRINDIKYDDDARSIIKYVTHVDTNIQYRFRRKILPKTFVLKRKES